MIYFQSSILILLSFIVLSFLAKKFDFLLSEFTNKHQELIGSEKIPLIGGSILFIFLIFNFQFFDKFFLITSFTLLVLGIFSDLDYLSSPKKRLLFQFIAIISFVLASDLFIDDLSKGQEYGDSYEVLYTDVIEDLKKNNINLEIFKNNWLEIKQKYLGE